MRLRFWLAAWMAVLTASAFVAPAFAAQDSASCTMPDQPLRPVIATHTQPPYPQMSVMTQEQGTTIVEVDIGADGVPTDAKVASSSGSIRLDEAAIEHVKTNWRWSAPMVNCKPTAAMTRVSVRWNLQSGDTVSQQVAPPTIVMDAKDFPPEALAKHEQGTVVLTIYVLTSGQVAMARVIQSSGFPELDAKSAELVKTWHWAPASLDGHPVNTSLIVLSVWKQADPGH